MSITIRKIAEAAHVSRGTVDKVLNNRPGVSAPVRERIQRLASELGYKPNAAGKSLAFQKNPVRIGFLLTDAHDPFYRDVQAGIERAASELAGLGVDVDCRYMAETSVAEQIAGIRALAQTPLAGLALAPLDDGQVRDELQRLIGQRGVRVVTSNSDLDTIDRLCFVGQDLLRSGRVAGELIGQMLPAGGRVLVLTGQHQVRAHQQRLQGFMTVLRATYPAVQVAEVMHDLTDNAMTYAAVCAFLDRHPAPDAILLTGHGTAGVGQALSERRREDIRFVCYDRIPETLDLLRRRIVNFTITQDPHSQGYLPVKILFDALFNGSLPEQRHIRTRIEVVTAESI